MILMEILSGPLCSGRFEVPSKYVAISAICLRENRRHLIWGLEVVTPVVESTTGGICLWQLRHKRAIVAKNVAFTFITLTFRNHMAFVSQSQSFSQSYGRNADLLPGLPFHHSIVNPHSAQESTGNPTPSKNQSGLCNCYMPCGQKTTEELKYAEVEDFFLLT